jgi:hypothetical protein
MELTCDGCSKTFAAARSDARFCSGRCRTLAYRVRRDGPRTPAKRLPLPDQLSRASSDLGKIVERWGRLAEDDRFRRAARNYPWHRNELLRAAEELRRIAETMEPSQTKSV